MKNTFSKGFTLVELLIVITILAALAAAVVVVLNPAELLAQARDAQRMSDMTTMRDSINLLLSQVPAANICFAAPACTAGGYCTAVGPAGNAPFGGVSGLVCTVPTAANLRLIDGNGWVSAVFTAMPGGSPIAMLPVDPTNTTTFFYAYKSDTATRTFRLSTRLESVRHRTMMQNDGGPKSACSAAPTWAAVDCFYEVGTNMLATF